MKIRDTRSTAGVENGVRDFAGGDKKESSALRDPIDPGHFSYRWFYLPSQTVELRSTGQPMAAVPHRPHDSPKIVLLFTIEVCSWILPAYSLHCGNATLMRGCFTTITIAILLRIGCWGCPPV